MDLLNSEHIEFYDQEFNDLPHTHISLYGKRFDNCRFDTCDFSESTLKECSFIDCTFTKCNLTLINIGNTKFSNTEFIHCKMRGIDWTKAYWRDLSLDLPFSFKECLISSSNFYGLNIAKVKIVSCKAHDTDFREADLNCVDFSNTDLTNSLFNNTNLTGANFYGATNYTINITQNTIQGAYFCRHEAVSLLESLGIELQD